MSAYGRVYESRHLQADCQEPGSAPESNARQSSTGYLYLFTTVSWVETILIPRAKGSRPLRASLMYVATDVTYQIS